jgi:hypothetical protein
MWTIFQTRKRLVRTKYLYARGGVDRLRAALESRKVLLSALTLSLGLVVVLQRKEVQERGHRDPDLLATKQSSPSTCRCFGIEGTRLTLTDEGGNAESI